MMGALELSEAHGTSCFAEHCVAHHFTERFLNFAGALP
jgi:hypothetical protein